VPTAFVRIRPRGRRRCAEARAGRIRCTPVRTARIS